jgi:hypothetical protein
MAWDTHQSPRANRKFLVLTNRLRLLERAANIGLGNWQVSAGCSSKAGRRSNRNYKEGVNSVTLASEYYFLNVGTEDGLCMLAGTRISVVWVFEPISERHHMHHQPLALLIAHASYKPIQPIDICSLTRHSKARQRNYENYEMQYLGLSSVQMTMSVSVFTRSKQAAASSTALYLLVLHTHHNTAQARKRIITDARTLLAHADC